MNKEWFEMQDVRDRHLDRTVWIPLRCARVIDKCGKYGFESYREEFHGVGTLAVYMKARDDAKTLDWPDIGINQGHSSFVDSGVYVPAELYRLHRGKVLGFYLVLEQRLRGEEASEWHLHQDIVFALGLKRERDDWICPEYDYITVARLTRDIGGKPILFEIRAEYLRDYMCARELALIASTYRSRVQIFANADHIDWADSKKVEKTEGDIWEGRVIAIHEGGMPFGEEWTILHAGRTDVKPDEDVPAFDFPTDDKITSESWEKKETGRKLYRVQGELWKNEWVEPGNNSYIVRGDKRPATVYFITDQAGNKETQNTLINEIRWLWFKPQVMMVLAHRRGGGLCWYTRDTGLVQCSPENGVHFGVNKLGLVNVFAKDIAALPEWQQRIWAGYNITPDGGVSDELLASQMKADPARTQAPEAFLYGEYSKLNRISAEVLGGFLFREHDQQRALFAHTHRFRAIDEAGLFALAKDLTRLISDSIDVHILQSIVKPPKRESWGSLKSLENVLSTFISAEDSHQLLSPLFGIYELRISDAHLRRGDIEEALKLVGADPTQNPIDQGYQMLHSCVSSIHYIAEVFSRRIHST